MTTYKIYLLMFILLLLTSFIYATGTTAGTVIKNQASATYKDSEGNDLTSTSNAVITTVLAKYAFEVTPNESAPPPGQAGQTQTATVANTVYYPYKLLNSSNTAETFKLDDLIVSNNTFTPQDVKIYHDRNGNGIVDPGDELIPVGSTFGPVGADDYFYLITAYYVPNTATAGQVAFSTPKVSSVNDPTLVDQNNNAKTTVVTGPVVTANITASPTTVKAGDTVSYSISGSNTGTSSAKSVTGFDITGATSKDGILVVNQLPTDVTYKANTTTISGPTNSIAVYSQNGTTWLPLLPATDPALVKYIGLFMPDATDNNLPEPVLAVGQAYELKYQVNVNAGTPAKIITDDAFIRFNDGSANTQTNTNKVDVEVLPTITSNIALGPKSDPTSTEFILGENLVATAPAGGTVTFYNAVRNTGTTADIFDLTFDKTDFPVGSIVQFYDVDGITPLSDSDNDGVPDTGIVAPGADRVFIVKVLLPGTATNNNAPHNLIVTATSSNDILKSDPVTNQLSEITRPALDIGNDNDDNDPGTPLNGTVDNNPKNITINPGASYELPLDVVNSGRYPDTFNLSVENLPAGYTVTYYLDKDKDGKLDADELIPTSSVSLPAWDGVGTKPEASVIAVISVPANTAPASSPVDFKIASSIDPTVTDKITDTIIVPRIAGVIFEPDRNGTGIPGGTVTYAHIITNTGNQADTFNFTFTSPNNWNYVCYDQNGNIINSITLGAGASQTVTIKGFVPTNAAVNTVDSMVATATSAYDNTKKDTVTDNTVVIAGVLQMNKTVTNITTPASTPNGKPGETLEYGIDYRNIATVNVKELKIVDSVPQYTTFVSMDTTMTGPDGKAIIFEWSTDGVTYTNYKTTPPVTPSTVKFLRWRMTEDGTTYYNIPAGFNSSPTKTLKFRVTINQGDKDLGYKSALGIK